MTTAIDTLKENIGLYIRNPSAIQQQIFNVLDDENIDVVDPTNPFVYLVNISAVTTAAAVEEHDSGIRKLYSANALNEDDLYLHMSDIDFLDRFATPTRANFFLWLDRAEVEELLVDDIEAGYKKLVIPRNSYFEIAGTKFSIEYPIEIRKMNHGGYQTVFNTDVSSPIVKLSTNEIGRTIRKNNTTEFIVLEIPTTQLSIVSTTTSISSAVAFKSTISYEDLYYYTRAFHANKDGSWTELKTTHTDQVFDITVPTVVLSVDQTNKTVTAKIPPVYTINGMINSKVRLDVYQTQGPVNLVLGNYGPDAFSANWFSSDQNDYDKFVAPLLTFKNMIINSLDTVSGGSLAKVFKTLREQVINNAVGEINPPVTGYQLEAEAKKDNFTIIKNVDVVTNRIFLATRDIEAPSDTSTYTGIAASIGVVETKMEDMHNLSGVKDNGERMTIMSRALFEINSGAIKHCSAALETEIAALNPEDRSYVVSNRSFLTTPFTYVLDATKDEFDLRAYHLDTPLITAKTFVQENDTTQLQVTTDSYSIAKSDTGYTMIIKTSSDDNFKNLDVTDIVVQIGYFPPNESERAYLNGEYLTTDPEDDEHYFKFEIGSMFDIDSDNVLKVNTFRMVTLENRICGIDLDILMDVFYTTKSTMGSTYVPNEIDTKIGTLYLDENVKAISHEQMAIKLGYVLDNLWKQARSTVTSKVYRTYETDVYETYKNDVYEADPLTGSIVNIINGVVVTNKIHSAGDYVLDADGNRRVKYMAGTVMKDALGNPIEVSPRTISRVLDIMFMDGVYKFATNSIIQNYFTETIDVVCDWIMDELQDIEDQLFEQTEIYFHPKKAIGTISVMVEDGISKNISAEQSLSVTLYVTDDVYKNSGVRSKLEAKTILGIVAAFKEKRLVVNEIVDLLKELYGSDVIGITLSGLGGSNNYPVVTILDDSANLSIKKKLTALASGELTVEEDIDINFIKHSKSE